MQFYNIFAFKKKNQIISQFLRLRTALILISSVILELNPTQCLSECVLAMEEVGLI